LIEPFMTEPTNSSGGSRWNVSPTQKSKNAVQRAVTALLDELAPERVVKRVDQIPGPVEQHRRPNGCVLQAANAAVSVTWFADVGVDAVFGELQVTVWHGSVTRRGAAPVRKGATTVAELVLRPIEPPEDGYVWRAADGTRYDTASLAAKCIALLQEQILARS
jgi:hypothetical protein